MRQISILIVFCWTFWGCSSTTGSKSEPVANLKSTRQVIGKKFFVYDAIDYYTNDFDESKMEELYDNQDKSVIDSFRMGVIMGDIPKSIYDVDFVDKLAKIGYKKTLIDKAKFASIDSIFVEKSTTENWATACMYVYRDILIFKKDNKIVGTAKICFDCMANQINGTTANTENFGQDGDYSRLEKLLRN